MKSPIAWLALSTFTEPYSLCSLSIPSYSFIRRCRCPKAPVPCLKLCFSSSSVLHRRRTHPGDSSIEYLGRVTFMYSTEAYSRLSLSLLAFSLNKTKMVAIHSVSLFCPTADTSTELLLSSSTAPLLSKASTRSSLLSYYPGPLKHHFPKLTTSGSTNQAYINILQMLDVLRY